MQSSRLLAILILLQSRGRLSAQALAREFEVSQRTIYRDIDRLSAAGVPVYGDKGPGGGFELLNNYRTRLTGLDHDEAQTLFLIGYPKLALDLGLGREVQGARNKLLAALTERGRQTATQTQAYVHIDPSDWYKSYQSLPQLPILTRALSQRRKISLHYESWKAMRTWQLAPLGLVLKASTWYLVAQGPKHIGTYKVENITELVLLEEGFERPIDFDLAHYWCDQVAEFEARIRPHQAQLRVSQAGLRYLRDLGDYGKAAVDTAQPIDHADWYQTTLAYETLDQAARLILSFGAEAEAIAPEALRMQIAALSQEIGQTYGVYRSGGCL